MPETRTPGGLYAHLRVGTCDIAVPVASVVVAMRPPAAGLTPVPRRQGAIAGVCVVKGSAVPVVALDRWVAVGEPKDDAESLLLVLRAGTAWVGIRVDALKGVKRIPADAVQVACHDADADELFEAVAPATADRPLLCLLEVGRLMALAATWCEQADIPSGRAAEKVAAKRAASTRYAVFAVGDALWALRATSISRLEKAPPPELRWDGRRVCGLGSWNGRKIPLVDLAAGGPGDASRPFMTVLEVGPLAIGLVVSRFERMAGLSDDEIMPLSGHPLLQGRAQVDGVGMVSVVSVQALFDAVPEATISLTRSHPVDPGPTTAKAATAHAGSESHYLVFEADRAYASPSTGLLGVVALPPASIDELADGRQTSIDWRGQRLRVVNLPALDGGKQQAVRASRSSWRKTTASGRTAPSPSTA